jgi:hypothetical protein
MIEVIVFDKSCWPQRVVKEAKREFAFEGDAKVYAVHCVKSGLHAGEFRAELWDGVTCLGKFEVDNSPDKVNECSDVCTDQTDEGFGLGFYECVERCTGEYFGGKWFY